MRNSYFEPEVEKVEFDTKDIVTTSDPSSGIKEEVNCDEDSSIWD